MKLLAAKANPGGRVTYTDPGTGAKESGVISHCDEKYVYVHYGEPAVIHATHPDNLKFDRSRR
ncbi:hypothetical protein EEB13_05400 [Rhodococcus sp. WS3]|uniref:hypothetical protein n=1 Tax=Rhodococcus sp. WS3 TaxID=2486271 RepID=UPI00114203B1|nr:hypothetical protein [Rhodococcus sp. WS3]ROZ49361.1 hypothetical protein EEB13_05400 [Rhodococcus sp. WS3]